MLVQAGGVVVVRACGIVTVDGVREDGVGVRKEVGRWL